MVVESAKQLITNSSVLKPLGNEVPQKEHQELKPYVHHLHIIDNQQMLFELSHRIEPRV